MKCLALSSKKYLLVLLLALICVESPAANIAQLREEKRHYQSELEKTRFRMFDYILNHKMATAALIATGGGLEAFLTENMDETTRNIIMVVGMFGASYCLNSYENARECAGVTAELTAYASAIDAYETKLEALDEDIAGARTTPPAPPDEPRQWQTRPLLDGPWVAVDQDEVGGILALVRNKVGSADRATLDTVSILRAMPLVFYKNATLYEAQITEGRGNHGVFTFVKHGNNDITVLDGTSAKIHGINGKGILMLENAEQALAYLKFFSAAIQGEDGTFRTIEKVDQIEWMPDADAQAMVAVASKISSVEVQRTGADWQVMSTVNYADALFSASYRVSPNGMVEMLNDQPMAADLPVRIVRFQNGVRYVLDQ